MKLKSFLNNLKPVSCYRNPNLSFADRFEKPEADGWKWRTGFDDWRSENGVLSRLHWWTNGYAFTKIEAWREDLHNLVCNFTLKQFKDKDFDKHTMALLKIRGYQIKHVKRDKRDELWVTLKNDRKIHFVTLTSYYPNLEKFMPELRTTERNRECHYLSRKLAIEHYLEGENAQVVTGVVNKLSPKYKYLHSWVEVMRDGQVIVFDSTENVVMKKKDYDMYYSTTELERIDGKTLFEEQDVYLDLLAINNAYSKLYLCSHDEAVKKWKELGLDKMTKEEREKFHAEQKERRLKEIQEKDYIDNCSSNNEK